MGITGREKKGWMGNTNKDGKNKGGVEGKRGETGMKGNVEGGQRRKLEKRTGVGKKEGSET